MSLLGRIGAVAERVDRRLQPLQTSRPWRAWGRYSAARGNVLAGGVAYFSFFSIFPAMALGFTAFAALLGSREDLQVLVVRYVNTVLGATVIGYRDGQGLVSIDQLAQPGLLRTTGLVGAVTLLFTGLGWIGALRDGVQAVFGTRDPRNPIVLKLADLLLLGLAGLVVLASVVVSVAVNLAAGRVLDLLGIPRGSVAEWTVTVLGQLALTAVDAVIYALMFHRLAGVRLPVKDVAPAGIAAAVVFTVLKISASVLLQGVTRNRFLATYGVIVGLLFWMNLVARLLLLAAALAATSAADRGHLAPHHVAEALPTAASTDDRTTDPGRGSGVLLAVGFAVGALVGGYAGRRRRPPRRL